MSHAITDEYPNVITLDVGGTSSDCALIPGAVPAVRRETVIGTLSVKAPSIDVHTVGAGGGSIAKYTAISHHFRQTGSYGQCAEMFGNSEAIIKRHYQGRVSTEETTKFYALKPTRKAKS